MRYPSDNFYQGHSLSLDLNHSGKDEFDLASKRLKRLGITPTPHLTNLSLDIIRQIHQFTVKNGKKEQLTIQRYIDRQRLTGDVLPIDITLAQHIFENLMNACVPYVTAGNIITGAYGLAVKIKQALKKIRTNDPVEKETKKIMKKILKKESDRIIKKIIRLQIKAVKNKPRKTRTRKRSQSKPQKRTKRKRK